MSEVNPYLVLALPPSASREEIKLQFRRLAKIYHPDKPTGNTAKFQEIKAAYEILSNPSSKTAFDSERFGVVSREQADAAPAPEGGSCVVCGGSGSVRIAGARVNGKILFWSNQPCPKGCKGRKHEREKP